mgnify:CR=1 FL=1
MSPHLAEAMESITLRSGFNESLSIPLSINVMDANITALTGPAAAELLNVPFTETLAFGLARSSSDVARVVNPHPNWALTQLAASPEGNELARWINPGPGLNTTLGAPAQSALYAMKFVVSSSSIPAANFKFNWSVDDALGDPFGTNPIGVYLNGLSLPLAFSGGGIGGESSASADVTTGFGLQSGDNWLYVYQRDTNRVVSGVVFAATLTIVPEPGPFALWMSGLLSAAIYSWSRSDRRVLAFCGKLNAAG